jgi:hypothetical protein
MFRRFLFTALLLSGRMTLAGDGPVTDFAPPGTNAVIGLRIRAIVDSGLVQNLGSEFFKGATAKWTASSPLPGIDPLKDLDEIVIFSAIQGGHQPSLSVIRGRFPADLLEEGAERYHGVALRKAQDGNVMALLDAGTMIAGDENLVRAAIDGREQHGAGLSPALAKRVAELSAGKYAIWGVGSVPGGLHPPAGKMPAGADGFQSLDRFDFGIGVDHDLQIALKLHVRSAEDAKKLAATMQFVQMMTRGQTADPSGVKFDGHVENGTLSLSLALPQEVVKKALDQQRDAIAQALAQAGGNPEPVARPQITITPSAPQELKIVSDSEGNTVQVTLPGKK